MREKPAADVIDRVKARLYIHFEETNQDLLNKDRQKYWKAAKDFVENRVSGWLNYGTNPLEGLEKKVETPKEEPAKGSVFKRLWPF